MQATPIHGLWLVLVSVALLVGLDGRIAPAGADETVAALTDRSRDPEQSNDFLRIIFVPAGVKPTALGLPAAVRVFAGASAFFRPPLPVSETVAFPGLVDQASQDLVVMRCVPPAKVEPTLATWPNVLELIVADLGGEYTCPAPPGVAENEVFCLAGEFSDEASPILSIPVARALAAGAAILASPARADVMRRRYGIFPTFTGLGFSVKGSGTGAPIPAADVLRRSIVPEYLLKNVTLAEAGCRCISVAAYPGREAAPLDPDQITRDGGDGVCVDVARLGGRVPVRGGR